MNMPSIGTLLRCGSIDERRIAYYHEIGLNSIQIAGVYEDWLAPGTAAQKASDAFFELFRKYGISVPAIFLGLILATIIICLLFYGGLDMLIEMVKSLF